jgi:hypothetical protein
MEDCPKAVEKENTINANRKNVFILCCSVKNK